MERKQRRKQEPSLVISGRVSPEIHRKLTKIVRSEGSSISTEVTRLVKERVNGDGK